MICKNRNPDKSDSRKLSFDHQIANSNPVVTDLIIKGQHKFFNCAYF